jgi:hypothetical protein
MDKKTNAKTEPATEDKAPIYIAYTVKNVGQGKNSKSYWSRIGVMFPHKDGNGFNLDLEAFPVNGKVALRLKSDKDQADATDEAAA